MRTTVRPLWLCADAGGAPADELVARTERVLARVAACVWLRPAANVPTRALLALARALRERTAAVGGALFVGDRIDVALAVGADGVHLGGASVSPRDARRALERAGRAHVQLSAAVHDAAQVHAAAPHADVLVLSPLGAVPGKGAALGVGGFAALAAHAPGRRFVALGGVRRPEDARAAARAGASAIAVRRALLGGEDPAAPCEELVAAFLGAAPR